MGHLDKIKIFFLMSFSLDVSAQSDTSFFNKSVLKINDSITKEIQVVFNPEKGLTSSVEFNRYFLKGILIEENTSILGKLNGMSRQYYKNGQLKEISNYIFGSRVGLFCEFYENEKIKTIGEYFLECNDSLVFLNMPRVERIKTNENYEIIKTEYNQGVKHGKWLYLGQTGSLIKTEVWDMGKLK